MKDDTWVMYSATLSMFYLEIRLSELKETYSSVNMLSLNYLISHVSLFECQFKVNYILTTAVIKFTLCPWKFVVYMNSF